MDFLKIGPFKIKNVKGPVNYKLELPVTSRIYPVFYTSLLKLADPDIPLDKNTKLEYKRTVLEYNIKIVVDYTIKGR